MNKFKHFFAFALLLIMSMGAMAQDELTQLPTDITVYDMDGNPVKLADIINHDGLTIVDFWATWCRPCHMEMEELASKYDAWTAETGVKMILISIDKEDKYPKIPPILEKYGWKGESYTDKAFEAKNAIGVNEIPRVFLVDKEGNIKYETLGYSPSGLKKMYKTIKKNAQ